MMGEKTWIKILQDHIKNKMALYNDMAMNDEEKLEALKKKLGEE